MTLLTTSDNFFVNKATGEITKAVAATIVDSGVLSRSYYSKYGQLECWSLDTELPDSTVPAHTVQSNRCIDCPRNIVGQRAKECKFFTEIKLVLNNTYAVSKLRVAGGSLFSKAANSMGLYEYKRFLKNNGEQLNTVSTEICFADSTSRRIMYFKPASLVSEDEQENLTRLILADANVNNLFNASANMKNESYILKRIEAKYPRLDQPYRFDQSAGENGKTVPCLAGDDAAKYELSFVMSTDQAKDLHKAMTKAYNAKRDKSWAAKFNVPFEKQDDGTVVGKANIKATFGDRPTGVPAQFDADNKRLDEDFLLTTGSTINLAVELVPYKMANTGVSLRIRGVQVIKYIPYSAPSPFESEEGFSKGDSTEEAEESVDDIFGTVEESPKEPTKRPKKKTETPPADDDLSDVIDEWGSDD